MKDLDWPDCRQALVVSGLFALLWFSWASHSLTLFNGLASPLFFALAALLVVLAGRYRIAVSQRSLLLFSFFSVWALLADARSGEFLPALAVDTHWLVLPLATLLLAQLFRDCPIAFQAVRVGAALCIVNLLLTLYMESEHFIHWHYPPVFGHIRHLGLSVGFMVTLLFFTPEVKGWAAVFFRLSRILGLALVFWSGTRASMLAWLCCIAVFVYCDRRWARTLVIDTIAGLALSLIPDPALPYQGLFGALRRSFGVASVDALSSSRIAIWKATLSGLGDIGSLWTGLGGNGFARLQVMHGVEITKIGHVHAHNFVVQSVCDWGLVGLALLGGFFWQSTLRPVIADRRNNNPSALAGVVYLLVTGMLDATLYHLEHLIYLAIALAYLFSQKAADGATRIAIPASLVMALLLGLALIHTQTFDYRIGLGWYFPTR